VQSIKLVFFLSSKDRRPAPVLSVVNLVLDAMSNNQNEHFLNVECILMLDALMNYQQASKFVSEKNGFKLIVRALYAIISFNSTSTAKLKMSEQFPHNIQTDFVQATFSLLSNLPPCAQNPDHSVKKSIAILASVVTQVMRQHNTQIKVQTAALNTLDKFMVPYPYLFKRFRQDTGPACMRNAIKLPDLSSESRAIAQKILCVCASHKT